MACVNETKDPGNGSIEVSPEKPYRTSTLAIATPFRDRTALSAFFSKSLSKKKDDLSCQLQRGLISGTSDISSEGCSTIEERHNLARLSSVTKESQMRLWFHSQPLL